MTTVSITIPVTAPVPATPGGVPRRRRVPELHRPGRGGRTRRRTVTMLQDSAIALYNAMIRPAVTP